LPPRATVEEVQLDFKDDVTVPADPEDKHQHIVETLNFVDAGTSSLLMADVSRDFTPKPSLRVWSPSCSNSGAQSPKASESPLEIETSYS
jgi:hypothetical protein